MADINKVKKINGKDIVVDWNNVDNKPEDIVIEKNLEEYAKKSEIPDVSNFITRTVDNLTNYFLKSETYSQEQIDNMVSSIPKFSIEVVDNLPTSNISYTTIYLLVNGNEDLNLYTEYIYVNNVWEKLGTQKLDLSGYYTKEEINSLLSNIDLSDYYTKIEINNLLKTKAEKSEIPTKVSELTNDSGYLTEHQSLDDYVKKVEGKDLSSNDYTEEEKNKLDGIEENANNYTHPDTHSGSMIEGFKYIYIQEEEPTDAEDGSLWIDTNEELGTLPIAEEASF